MQSKAGMPATMTIWQRCCDRRGLQKVCLGNLGQDEGNPYGVPENVDPAGTQLKERPHELDLSDQPRAVDRGLWPGSVRGTRDAW